MGGIEYSVRHGEDYLLLNNCSRCRCEDGEPEYCEQVDDCSKFTEGERGPRGCQLNGTELAHQDTFQVDCNMCGCRNGKITCTHRTCEVDDDDDGDDDEEEACETCRKQSRSPVCGPDSRTYHSACYAINCLGYSPADLRPGPCSSYVS